MPDRPPPVARSRRLANSDLRWEDRADELELQALDQVRSAAEKWAASLAAILGLFGALLVVKSREDISRLTSGFEIAVACLLLIGFCAAAYATWQAALAAQGTPEDLRWPTGPGLRRWELERAREAKQQLRRSRQSIWLAVIALVLAIGLTWFGKSERASAERVQLGSGPPSCMTNAAC
jgi:lysylphosphatidylglycerol synthetase-like protein (DUF2156 family)